MLENREQLVGYIAQVQEIERMQVDPAPAAATPAPAADAKDAAKDGKESSQTDGKQKEGEKDSEEKAKEREKERDREREEAAWLRKMLTVPEAEAFVLLLGAIYLLDQQNVEPAMTVSWSLIQRIQSFNRR
jgi:hypothetical protein